MSNFEKTFTIKITELPDGRVKLWVKGIPDTRSFAGTPIVDAPKSHALGLFALGRIMDAIEAQGWTLYKKEKVET